MFALCFTSAAAAELRRTQVRTTPRKQANPALKAARVGLAAIAIVLAAASPSLAGKNGNGGGKPSGGRSNGSSFRMQSSGGNNFSQSVKKFNQSNSGFNTIKSTPKLTTNNIGGGNSLGNRKDLPLKSPIKLDNKIGSSTGQGRTNPWNPKLTTKVGGLSNVVNKNSTILTLPGNKKVPGATKNNPLIKKIDPIFSNHGKGSGNGIGIGTGKKNDCHIGNGKNKCHNWDWCWKQHCKPCYKPCQQNWHCWTYPKWCGLYRHTCGHYVNVPVVVVQGVDLQLLAIRLVDSGDAEQNLGPRFRVWIRNNTPAPLLKPFNVLALAARDVVPSADLPQAGVRIESMQPAQILPVDIRLPIQANDPNLGMVHVLVDSHRELAEAFEDNNGLVLPRSEVMSVDPALLAADTQAAAPGAEINIAGEGLGAAPGQVIVKLAGLDMAGEVIGWSELGLRIRLPVLQIVNPVDAQIIAIRADGKQIPPLPLKVVPGQVQVTAQPSELQPTEAVGTTDQATAMQAMFGG